MANTKGKTKGPTQKWAETKTKQYVVEASTPTTFANATTPLCVNSYEPHETPKDVIEDIKYWLFSAGRDFCRDSWNIFWEDLGKPFIREKCRQAANKYAFPHAQEPIQRSTTSQKSNVIDSDDFASIKGSSDSITRFSKENVG